MSRIFASLFCGLLFVLTSFPTFAGKVKISYNSLEGSLSPLWAAKERGFFNRHGIDAELIYILGGRISAQAMLAGEVQMGVMGTSSLIRACLSGGDLVYVANSLDLVTFTLIAQKGITDVKQLRGKRVGIGAFGGGPDYTVRIVLEKNGLKPDKDVAVVQMNVGQPGRVAAVQTGAIEAVVINPPFTLQAKKLGLNLLIDFSTVIPSYLQNGVATTRKFILENPLAVENSLKAFIDGVRYVLSDEKGTSDIIRRYMKMEDPSLLKEYYRGVILKEISREFYIKNDAIEFVLDQERKTNQKAKDAKVGDFVDTRFLDKLKKEGYF